MKSRVCLLTILLNIFLFVACTGKVSKKVTDVNTGFAEGTGKISGKVTDINTGEPLHGTNIPILGSNRGAAADTNGLYTISNVPPGSYSMQARMMGYKSVTVNDVIVVADSTTIINLQLSPAEIKEEGVRLGPK